MYSSHYGSLILFVLRTFRNLKPWIVFLWIVIDGYVFFRSRAPLCTSRRAGGGVSFVG